MDLFDEFRQFTEHSILSKLSKLKWRDRDTIRNTIRRSIGFDDLTFQLLLADRIYKLDINHDEIYTEFVRLKNEEFDLSQFMGMVLK